MVDLRKKNAAKLKASLAAEEEAVELTDQIEDEDSDDIAADEVSVRELPNDPWKKMTGTGSNTAPQFIPVETMKEVVNQAVR